MEKIQRQLALRALRVNHRLRVRRRAQVHRAAKEINPQQSLRLQSRPFPKFQLLRLKQKIRNQVTKAGSMWMNNWTLVWRRFFAITGMSSKELMWMVPSTSSARSEASANKSFATSLIRRPISSNTWDDQTQSSSMLIHSSRLLLRPCLFRIFEVF